MRWRRRAFRSWLLLGGISCDCLSRKQVGGSQWWWRRTCRGWRPTRRCKALAANLRLRRSRWRKWTNRWSSWNSVLKSKAKEEEKIRKTMSLDGVRFYQGYYARWLSSGRFFSTRKADAIYQFLLYSLTQSYWILLNPSVTYWTMLYLTESYWIMLNHAETAVIMSLKVFLNQSNLKLTAFITHRRIFHIDWICRLLFLGLACLIAPSFPNLHLDCNSFYGAPIRRPRRESNIWTTGKKEI